MVLSTDELIYEQAKDAYNKIILRIESYDEKSFRIFTMATTGLGIIFIILPLVIDAISKHNIDLTGKNLPWIIGLVFTFIISASSFIYTLSRCTPILMLNKYSIMNTDKLYTKYSTSVNTSLLKGLIKQVNNFNNKNQEKLEILATYYKNGISAIRLGILSFAGFMFFSLVLLLILYGVI